MFMGGMGGFFHPIIYPSIIYHCFICTLGCTDGMKQVNKWMQLDCSIQGSLNTQWKTMNVSLFFILILTIWVKTRHRLCRHILHLLLQVYLASASVLRSFHSAFECVLTVLLVIKFMDPSASEACIHLSELKTNSGTARACVAKYSLIFCGYLISQEWTWLIRAIRSQRANINQAHTHPTPRVSSRYQPWAGLMRT